MENRVMPRAVKGVVIKFRMENINMVSVVIRQRYS